jgi:hypothetical protein
MGAYPLHVTCNAVHTTVSYTLLTFLVVFCSYLYMYSTFSRKGVYMCVTLMQTVCRLDHVFI